MYLLQRGKAMILEHPVSRTFNETQDACITHPETCSNGGTMAVWINIREVLYIKDIFLTSSDSNSTSLSIGQASNG